MVYIVSRNFGMDFIYFDILFCVIWMLLLLRKKYVLQWLFGLFGVCVVFFVDYVIWFKVKETRIFHEVPFNEGLFLLYFSFTYGMIEFSYVAVMFSAKNWKTMLNWSLLLYGGWFVIAFLSQWIPLHDQAISISRVMTDFRWGQLGMAIGGYLVLIILKYTWKPFKHLSWLKLAILVLIGFLVHFGMEITLLAAGIRPLETGAIGVLFFNSLIEFNTGVPFLYLGWILLKDRKISTGIRDEIHTSKVELTELNEEEVINGLPIKK